VSNSVRRILDQVSGGSRLRREAVLAAAALLVGLLLMPVLVWLAGRFTLGEYTHGGVFALLADYLRGLARGEMAFWIMLLGPYGFLLLGRFAFRIAR
jgi:hypothetical protein